MCILPKAGERGHIPRQIREMTQCGQKSNVCFLFNNKNILRNFFHANRRPWRFAVDMKKAEDGKYFNTIQLIAKVI
jgi:hypothetical protein